MFQRFANISTHKINPLCGICNNYDNNYDCINCRWGLTALNWHFESQCIPTPLSWYAHQLPEWLLKLQVAGTYYVEILVPFLFFVPVRSLRLFSFWCQVSDSSLYSVMFGSIVIVIITVEPLIKDPPRKGQPLYKGHFQCPQLCTCVYAIHFQLPKRGQTP